MTWLEVNLEQVLSLEYGSALPKRHRNRSGSIPVVGSNGIIGTHTESIVTEPGIVVGRKGSAGKISWIEPDFGQIDGEASLSHTSFYVRPIVPVEVRWLFYLLHFLNLERLAIGDLIPVLIRNDAYQLKISLPTLSEQRKIVEILDHADMLRQKRAEADAKIDRILPAFLSKMFGNPATNPKGLPDKRLNKIMKANIDTQAVGSLSTLILDVELPKTLAKIRAGLDLLTVKRAANANAKLDKLFDLLLQRAFSGELTAKWRKAHKKQLQIEMKEQAKVLATNKKNSTKDRHWRDLQK